MTISKEERAELRELVANVTLPFPWEAVEATVLSGENDFIAECDEDDEECSEITTLIASAVNALPKTLDALDAADERIAGLEADVALLRTENDICLCGAIFECERLYGGDLGRYCKECVGHMSAKAETATLKARIAELEAAAQWRPIEEAPKDGREVLVTYRNRGQVHFADYSGHQWWKRGPGREPLTPQPTHYLAIPALPEGGA